MALKIIKATEVAKSKLSLLIYGLSGSGKTCLARTLGKTLVINAEAGTLSLAGATNIDIVDVPDWRAMQVIAAELARGAANEYQWIVIDSLSEIAEKAILSLKETNKNGLAAYGEMNDTIIKMVRFFRDSIASNVVFLSKSEYDKDEESGRMMWRPSFPGKRLLVDIPYLLDEVFYLQASESKEAAKITRRLVCNGSEKVAAKDRSGQLSLVEPAHLGYIEAKIRGQPIAVPDGYALS